MEKSHCWRKQIFTNLINQVSAVFKIFTVHCCKVSETLRYTDITDILFSFLGHHFSEKHMFKYDENHIWGQAPIVSS